MDRKELLKNLVAMAAADGSFSEREILFLGDRCVKWGITDPDFAEALATVAANPQDQVTIPDSKDACIELLQELVRMMAADGHLADDEKQLFAVAAGSMAITTAELDQLIDDVLAEE